MKVVIELILVISLVLISSGSDCKKEGGLDQTPDQKRPAKKEKLTQGEIDHLSDKNEVRELRAPVPEDDGTKPFKGK